MKPTKIREHERTRLKVKMDLEHARAKGFRESENEEGRSRIIRDLVDYDERRGSRAGSDHGSDHGVPSSFGGRGWAR